MRGHAHAKVNLSLRVGAPRADGLHPLVSLVQSISWSDTMELVRAGSDRFESSDPDLPAAADNLAWRAVTVVRSGGSPPLHLTLDKAIPVAAGLGGGSADAALGLALSVAMLGGEIEAAVASAPSLGADVPFCLAGGTAWMEGIGERITPLPPMGGYWLGVVVPPFSLPTSVVYRRWDELGGPVGPSRDGRSLPTALREHGPLGNDLHVAAVDLVPALGDWVSDLSNLWGQPVSMSGSGPSLFGFFPTESEATDAVSRVRGARASRAVEPLPVGWVVDEPGRLPLAPWLAGA